MTPPACLLLLPPVRLHCAAAGYPPLSPCRPPSPSPPPGRCTGVGPATASAVLAAFDDSIPFQSDEAVAASLGSKAKYSIEEHLELTQALRRKAKELSSSGRRWTAKDVEACLYAEAAEAKAGGSSGGSKKWKR